MNLTSTLGIAGLSTTIFIVINWLRYLTNWKTHKVEFVTQILVWVGGIVLLALAAHAQITQGIQLFGSSLSNFDLSSIILGGIILGSTASTGNTILGAIDSTRSSSAPDLLPKPAQDAVTPPVALSDAPVAVNATPAPLDASVLSQAILQAVAPASPDAWYGSQGTGD